MTPGVESEVAALVVSGAMILPMDPSLPEVVEGWLSVGDDGVIIEIGQGAAPAARKVVEADGAFVAPGFVSAHSHLFTSGSRGLGTDSSLYGWIEAMTRYTQHADADDIYWCTLHGALDFVNNGITTAYDFTSSRLPFSASSDSNGAYGGSLRSAGFAEAQLRAKVDAGIRFINSVMLDDSVGTTQEVVERFEETMAFGDRYRELTTYLGMAISGGVQWAPSRASAQLESSLMERFGVINQPHLLETPHAIADQQERFWWYRDAGALSESLIFGHFIHTTPEIVDVAAREGCAMSWQPTSNGRLGSGIADIPGYRRAGMRIGVGLDDQSCTDSSDPWQNMRMGLYLLRASHRDPEVIGVKEMLTMHTLGSAEALGVDDRVGSLAPGKFADFLIVDPRTPDTGPVWDPFGTYVLACGLRNLKQVWIGGRRMSTEGVSSSIDGIGVSKEMHERLGVIKHRIKDRG
ncbi:MAG: amidohydrolase family protein [Ferrimicrobium sp.]